MRIRAILTILVACFGLWSSTAEAQDESLNRARDAFDSGQDLFQNGKFTEAAEKFKAAYEARPFTQFLFNIGACYEKASDYTNALDYYGRYLKDKPREEEAEKTRVRIATLQKAVDQLKASGADPSKPVEAVKDLGKVAIRGFVVIESEPQGANIYLDDIKGEALSKTPWNGSFAGQHVVIIERKGYKSAERTIRPDPNKMQTFVFVLGEEDYLGYLDVSSNIPGANIYIDDKSVGVKATTPWSGEIKPGKHKVWITKEGYSEYKTEIEVIAGETHKVSAKLEGAEVGYLNVRGKGVERYKIYVDGKLLCKRGPCLKPLAAGKHRVSIRQSGHRTYNQKIDVQSKTEVTMRANLAKAPSRRDAIVSYVFAAAFLGGGYFLGTKAQDIEDELKAEIDAGAPPPDTRDPRLGWGLKSGKTYSVAANAAYGLGATTLILAVYYTFRDKGIPSTGTSDIRAISFEPSINPDFAGLGLAGSF
jgi:tetratricopeptide (TPR) repeat protein